MSSFPAKRQFRRRSSPFPNLNVLCRNRTLRPITYQVKALRTVMIDNIDKNLDYSVILLLLHGEIESIQARQCSHDQAVQSIQVQFATVRDAEYCMAERPFGFTASNYCTKRVSYNVLNPAFSIIWNPDITEDPNHPLLLWKWIKGEKHPNEFLLQYAEESGAISSQKSGGYDYNHINP